jgi:hypothetical protein
MTTTATLIQRTDGERVDFVPPEPSSIPPKVDWKHVPRWVQIVMVVCVIAIGILAIWLSR